jgi:hypothetical protein
MKKLILLLCIITKLTPSGTILEVIKPHPITGDDLLINTLVMSFSLFGLRAIKKKIGTSLKPVEGQHRKNISKCMLKHFLASFLSPVVLIPIMINIKKKREIVSPNFLLKFLLLNTSLNITEDIIKNTILKTIIKLPPNIMTDTIIYFIIQIIISDPRFLNLMPEQLIVHSNPGEFLMYLLLPEDPQCITKIHKYFRLFFIILELKLIYNDIHIKNLLVNDTKKLTSKF